MSNTFFASVRRNQKQWMVVVTVLSMVSFLFLDDFGKGKGPMSPLGGGLMIGCLVAAGMSIIGYPRGLTAELGGGGFVVGFLAGYLGFGAVGAAKPLVQTANGSFSRSDLDHISTQRAKANQFAAAVMRRLNSNQPPGFGGVDDSSILTYQMLLADAKKMGIQVSDERVNDFLKQLTQGQLTKKDFKECLREARLSEGELFEHLKSELSTQLVIGLMEPPAYVPPIPPELARFIPRMDQGSMRYMQQTPHQLWNDYQKLTLKQSLQAAAIPVSDFVSKISDPSETEIIAFFERHSNQRWIDKARPGFMKMPRVQLAYLTAEFEKFEKGADPSDAEIQFYYDSNKEDYRVMPEKEPKTPETPPAQEPNSAASTEDSAKPADAEKPKDPTPPAEGEKKDGDAANAKEEVSKDDPKSKCGDDAAATEKPSAEKAVEAKVDEAKTESVADQKADAAAAKPDAKPGDAAADPALPNLSSSPESLPAPKYRELDDELKLEIRDAILRERTFERIAAELDKAQDFMVGLGLDYDTTDKDKKPAKAKEIAEQLKGYAKSNKLDYHETGELTYEELLDEPIGSAFVLKGGISVVNDLFSQLENGEPRMSLYSPHRANSKPAKDAFAYWKTAQFPAEPASLKDESTRANAVLAWKFDQARLIAEKRARDLVTKIKVANNDLPAVLSSETVTGEKDDPAITITPTDEFTWLTNAKNVPRSEQGPAVSVIPLINDIGDRFMQTVFEELGDGDVGVAADDFRAVFYIVKVMNRETGKNDEGGVVKYERQQQFLKEEFASRIFPITKSPYQVLAQHPQQQIDMTWRQNFERDHKVEWREDAQPTQNSRPRGRRR